MTVVPRGNALGLTMQLPEMDKTGYSKRELLATIDVCMGGRIAEELIYGTDEVTTGASNDLEKATAYAKEMVVRYGMSDKVGPVSHTDEALDKLSTETRAVIESEIKSMLEV